MSNIEWTDTTWNPVVGCTPVSPGCLNCYAAGMARRLEAMGKPWYAPRTEEERRTISQIQRQEGVGYVEASRRKEAGTTIRIAEVKNGRAVFTGEVRTLEDRLTDPLGWKKPRRVFVNSMSDLFHESVPFEFIDKVFAVMALCPQHTFQVLTKRPERMAEYLLHSGGKVNGKTLEREAHIGLSALGITFEAQAAGLNRVGSGVQLHRDGELVKWPLPNVWLGTSMESDDYHARAWKLLECPAAVRFLSVEPMIGPVDLNRWELLYRKWIERKPTMGRYLDWVIVGGESGPNARPCDVAWIREVVAQCQDARTPVFVKQLGARPYEAKKTCDDCMGTGREQMPCDPDDLRCEFCDGAGEHGGPLRLLNRKGGDMAEWPEDLRVREWPTADRAGTLATG